MTAARRTLPIRYPPYPGEALDSWLEYLAHRLHCRLGDVLHALDLPYNDHDPPNAFTRRWTTLVTPEELAAIHQVTGVPPDVLAAMTLQPFDHHAVVIDHERRRVHRQSLWGRTGSRFCPACLTDSNGRWPLTWRLGWSFACTRHHVLLADRCPACSRIPRFRTHSLNENPRPGRCANPAPDGGPRRRCHHPLTAAPVTAIEPGGRLEETQSLINSLLARPARTVHWRLYGAAGAPLGVVLQDAKCLATLILNHATADDLRTAAPADVLERMERYRANPLPARSQRGPDSQRLDVHSYYAPADAAATAVAVTAVLPVLRADSIRRAGQAVEWLTDRVAATGRPLYAGALSGLGGSVSPVLEAALRCSRELRLLPVTRLRRRTTDHSTHPPGHRDTRARLMPTALWPAWDLRLAPRHPNGRPVAQRADEILTVACLLAGSTTPTAALKQLTGTTVSNHNLSTLLADLTRRDDCADVLHTLILLADHLDAHGARSTTRAAAHCSHPAAASWTRALGTICSAACARTSGPTPCMPSAGSSRP